MGKKFLLVTAFLLCFVCCGDPVSYGNIPDTTIYFSVDLRLYPNLKYIGNYEYFPYGYSGVFVYHIGDMDEEYVAFEQACPLDWKKECYVEFDGKNARLVGTKCGCRFSSLTGYCYDHSGYGLRKLNITWNGSDLFFVSN